MISQVLGERYQIQQQLSKKPGRETFLACDLVTQELVVIKILKFGGDLEWDHLKLFEREAQILQTLSLPAIPKYLNGFDLDLPNCKGFVLVQTYIKAMSLETHLKAGRTFSEAEVKQLAEKLLKILIYLHEQKPPIIHRDIKPSNILLNNRSGNNVGNVYLVDFGSVQNLAAVEGGTFTVVGTYGYMPVEQFGGRAVPASDLYSLGATLIYLMTRVHPSDLPQKDFRIQFEQVTELSLEFSRWLRKIVEPSLDRRFSSAKLALQALKQPAFLDSAPLIPRKPAGSKLLLTKSAAELQIIIPSFLQVQISNLSNFKWSLSLIIKKMLNSLRFIIEKIVSFGLFIVFFGWMFIAFLAAGFHFFPLAGWLILGCLFLAVIHKLFYKVRLRINQDNIYFYQTNFGLQIITPSLRKDIIKIERICPYIKITESPDSYSSNLVPSSIAIWAGTQQYELKYLTEPELDWLAYELSEWLELPIEIRQVHTVKSTS
ncbi:MAG: serine/threonine protein kinase [Microcoleus vaginatus WJT46-NPBG5]|jgi:serine/threonine protein kinase|nr:serine/threonine protein kinase [Microcoleus vaginatus WJT46-NPBG5]